MITIELSRVAGRAKFPQVAIFQGEIVGSGRAPFFNACRTLIAKGHPSDAKVRCHWQGSNVVSFEGTLGQFAEWNVEENEKAGPRFIKWKAREVEEGA